MIIKITMDNIMNQLTHMSEVKLIDKEGKYFEVKFGYQYLKGNEQSYFSITTQNGQDKFVPDGEYQEQLLELWQKYHLTPINKSLETITTIILDELQQSLEDDWNTRATVTNMPVDYLKEQMGVNSNVGSEYEYHAIAIAKHCDCTLEEMMEISNRDNYFECQGGDYIVATDSEADDLWDESLDAYLEECVYPEIPKWIHNYFDDDKWKSDAKMDGRGHSLSSYDGNEYEIKIADEWYFIYKQ